MKRKFEYIRAEGLEPGHVFTLRVKTFKAEVLPLQPGEDEWFTGVVISKVDVDSVRRKGTMITWNDKPDGVPRFDSSAGAAQ